MAESINFFRKNWFLLGLIAALLGGYFFSGIGTRVNPGNRAGTAVVVLIFFILGMSIKTAAIRSGLGNLKLHIYIQFFIFVFFPATVFATSFILRPCLEERLFIGLFTLSCLPTTASSCIVFTRLSGGNTAGSMINSSLANIIGVFISPLILSLLLRGAGDALPVNELLRILFSLLLKMFAPLIAGQLVRLKLKEWIDRNAEWWKGGINFLILVTIFFAFSRAASGPLFREGFSGLTWLFVYLAVIHVVFLFAAYFGGRLIGLGREDRIAALFTASQKTVVLGVPLINSFFIGRPELMGIALLPLVFYHSYQLIVAGVVKSLPFIRRGR